MTFVPSSDDNPSAPARDTRGRVVARDKKNRTNLHWYVVRTQPHQEAMLCDLLSQAIQAKTPNILEFYCPVRTTVRQVDESKKTRTPLFCAHVFVLGTHQAITDFLLAQYPQGKVLNRRTPGVQSGRRTVGGARGTDESLSGVQRELLRPVHHP